MINMGLFNRKKKVEEKPQLIFEIDNKQMVHVKCPYCLTEIDCVIVHLFDKGNYKQCPECSKELD